MGTNYYYKEIENPCPHCGRGDVVYNLHVGKSSGGWTFALHIYPEIGINTLDDWETKFCKGEITDEYGDKITAQEMSEVIRKRSCSDRGDRGTQKEMIANHAVPGPNNLWRHRIDGLSCVRHGEGTWDYHTGEFS